MLIAANGLHFEDLSIKVWEQSLIKDTKDFFDNLAQCLQRPPETLSIKLKEKCITFLSSSCFINTFMQNDEEGSAFFLRIPQQIWLIKELFCRSLSQPYPNYFKKLLPLQSSLDENHPIASLYQACILEDVTYLEQNLNGIGTLTASPWGYTTLHAAAEYGREKSMPLLLERIVKSSFSTPSLNKLKLNLRDREGKTPLHYACFNGHLKVIDLLLAHQGDLFIENNNKKSPLDLACLSKSPDVLNFLFEYFGRSILEISHISIQTEEEIEKVARIILNYTKFLDHISSSKHIPTFFIDFSLHFIFSNLSPDSLIASLSRLLQEANLNFSQQLRKTILSLIQFIKFAIEEPHQTMLKEELTFLLKENEKKILKIKSEQESRKVKQEREVSLQNSEENIMDEKDIYEVFSELGVGLYRDNDINSWEKSAFIDLGIKPKMIYDYGLYSGKDLRALGINFTLNKALADHDYVTDKVTKQSLKDSICKTLEEELKFLESLPSHVQKQIKDPFIILQNCLIQIEIESFDKKLKDTLREADRSLKRALLRCFLQQEVEFIQNLFKKEGLEELGQLQEKHQLNIKDMFQLKDYQSSADVSF